MSNQNSKTLGASNVYDMAAKINEVEFTCGVVDLSKKKFNAKDVETCLLYTSPSPRDS